MTFADDLNRMLAEALASSGAQGMAEEYRVEYDTTPLIKAKVMTAYLPASLDLLVDVGALSESEARAQGWTPPPPPSRRDRLRWRWQAWRERAGRKIGGWVAGVDLSERDDDW